MTCKNGCNEVFEDGLCAECYVRAQKIDDIEEEILYINNASLLFIKPGYEDVVKEVKNRIIAREEAALAELRQGMKEEG